MLAQRTQDLGAAQFCDGAAKGAAVPQTRKIIRGYDKLDTFEKIHAE
jgi:hypothetical protein